MASESWALVDEYLNERLVPSDDALDAAVKAGIDAGMPQIQVSPTQGKFLFLLARMLGARRILEIGTLAGYSTIWLGRALPPDGRLISLEVNPAHADVARADLRRAGLDGIVEVRVGRALDLLAALAQEGVAPFDLVFVDADKDHNPEYVDLGVEAVTPRDGDSRGQRGAPWRRNRRGQRRRQHPGHSADVRSRRRGAPAGGYRVADGGREGPRRVRRAAGHVLGCRRGAASRGLVPRGSVSNRARDRYIVVMPDLDLRHPRAIAMWDISWLLRRWPGAGFEDWDRALDELVERGYDAVRLEAFPHLLSVDPDAEWEFIPGADCHDWAAPCRCGLGRGRLSPTSSAAAGIAASPWGSRPGSRRTRPRLACD